jgi:hypothetical protein
MCIPLTTMGVPLSPEQIPLTSLGTGLLPLASNAPAGEGGNVASGGPEFDANCPLGQWLSSLNPVLEQYRQPLSDYGFENLGMLMSCKHSDLTDAFEELNVKRPHRSVITDALLALKAQQ